MYLLPELTLNFEVKQASYYSLIIFSNKMIYTGSQTSTMKIKVNVLKSGLSF